MALESGLEMGLTIDNSMVDSRATDMYRSVTQSFSHYTTGKDNQIKLVRFFTY